MKYNELLGMLLAQKMELAFLQGDGVKKFRKMSTPKKIVIEVDFFRFSKIFFFTLVFSLYQEKFRKGERFFMRRP